MAFSPVEASRNIKEKYYRYLKTFFKPGEPYSKEFNNILDIGDSFTSGPYLDVTDAFTKGKSINSLIDEGILPQSFRKININHGRPLYLHQEKAIRKIAMENRNLVVSTGTGSGKTESFLIPVLRQLVQEYEAGTLSAGVRTLLIYPMNALANDQTERLRGLLKDYPEITFGVYTGQTEQTYDKALAEYKSLNNNETPIPNELICRDQMIAKPPHILITNYAMLEYLMLRPRDSVFFDGDKAQHWKFIVFDEAHVYGGSTGIEVSMLFRRLKAKLQNQKITYILTSATLGDKEDDEKVAEFASNLCDAPFSSSDIVRAFRITPETTKVTTTLPLSFYKNIAELKYRDSSDDEIRESLPINSDESIEEFLYDNIVNDNNFWKIRSILQQPNTVKNITTAMNWTEKELIDFVTVATMAEKNGGKLFDARYHMFIRAADSAFVTLAPDNRIMLDRCKYRTNSLTGDLFKVFEIAVCSYCNAIYLVGKIENKCLEQSSAVDEGTEKALFLLSDMYYDTDCDHTLENEGLKVEPYYICPYCGFVKQEGSNTNCEHGNGAYIKVFRVNINNESNTLTKCPHCENTKNTGVLRMFFSGQEAATSVIGTALFEELPSYMIINNSENKNSDDELGLDFGVDFEETEKEKTPLAKQFIAFSDSRQAAAFYASYLNISYNNILYKRLIIEQLKKRKEPTNITDFADKLHNLFNAYNIYGKSALKNEYDHTSEYTVEKESWKAILSELTDNNGNTALTHFGLLGIDLDLKQGEFKKYNISHNELRALCSVFASSMLADAAIVYDAPLNDTDIEDFTHNGVMYSYTLSDSSKKYHKAFLPTRTGMSNKRVDYVLRILGKKGFNVSVEEVETFLTAMWERLLIGGKFLVRDDNAYKIDVNKIVVYKPEKWYICNKCHKLTCHNIENVCPSYKCDGELSLIDPQKYFAEDHYYKLYNDLEIRDLRIVEHTAQLNRDEAYNYQKQFKQKEIDILSCSTTFEMGVDVGSLETVFMRNMPPMPANYAQRAGRAGRSKLAAAFALTFCNKSSHDFSFFNDPTSMIKGKINPPKYSISNDRIAIRHLYAAALSFFWKIHPNYFNTIGNFLKEDDRQSSGYKCFVEYLNSKPNELKNYLKCFLPPELVVEFEVDAFGWLDKLIGENGVLTQAISSYFYEYSTLDELKNKLFLENKNVGGLQQRLRAYSSENILTFLSRKNVLPKYGFPVDTVEMSITANKKGQTYGLQLQRDLSMAISEYAPGSQIVANNKLITSRYINKIPSIGWKMYSYIKCDNCNTLNVRPSVETDDDSDIIIECCQCKTIFTKKTKTFLIPAQGFVADGNTIRTPGLKKPEKTYRGEISYVGFSDDSKKYYDIGNAVVEVITSHNDEMAVLNESNFYVCEKCGYAEVDDDCYVRYKQKTHKSISGYNCSNNKLKRFSLGYRFLTDVVKIRFDNYEINDFEQGLSILYGLLRGFCRYLNIEEKDISGCLQSYPTSKGLNYSIIIFDNTPGGAGHAKRLDNPEALKGVIRTTLKLMRDCVCGGEQGDSSCYSCIRNYRNQKYHDKLKRNYVIDFLSEILSGE